MVRSKVAALFGPGIMAGLLCMVSMVRLSDLGDLIEQPTGRSDPGVGVAACSVEGGFEIIRVEDGAPVQGGFADSGARDDVSCDQRVAVAVIDLDVDGGEEHVVSHGLGNGFDGVEQVVSVCR